VAEMLGENEDSNRISSMDEDGDGDTKMDG